MMISIKKRDGSYSHLFMNYYDWLKQQEFYDAQMGKISPYQYLINIKQIERMEELNQLRVNLDGLAQLVKAETNGNYMLTVCEQCILMAKAWTGKLLGELGGKSPYSSGKTKVEDIEPTDAKSTTTDELWKTYNNIQKLDVLRTSLKGLAEQVKVITLDRPSPDGIQEAFRASREANICRTHVWSYIEEASIYAGFRLGEIRDLQ